MVVALVSTLLLDSCSVQKRYHRKGFNVNLNHTSIGGKKEKFKATYENAVEETTEINTTNTGLKAVQKETTYSNQIATSDFATSSNEISLVNNLPVENKLIEKNTTNETTVLPSQTETSKSKISKKKFKQTIAEMKQKSFHEKNSLVESWVYLLLILLVPFGTVISMYLYEGSWTKRVTVNLILTLLCGLPGLIHAFVVIFGNK